MSDGKVSVREINKKIERNTVVDSRTELKRPALTQKRLKRQILLESSKSNEGLGSYRGAPGVVTATDSVYTGQINSVCVYAAKVVWVLTSVLINGGLRNGGYIRTRNVNDQEDQERLTLT